MDGIIEFIGNMDIKSWVVAVNALLVGFIAIFSLIPGEQPEKTMQFIVDLLKKFSKK